MKMFLQGTPGFRGNSARSNASTGSKSPLGKRSLDDPTGPKSPGDHLTNACVLRDQPAEKVKERFELKLQCRDDDDMGEESPLQRDDLDSISSRTGYSATSSRVEGKKQRTRIKADHLSSEAERFTAQADLIDHEKGANSPESLTTGQALRLKAKVLSAESKSIKCKLEMDELDENQDAGSLSSRNSGHRSGASRLESLRFEPIKEGYKSSTGAASSWNTGQVAEDIRAGFVPEARPVFEAPSTKGP